MIMIRDMQRIFLLTIGLLFCVFGCTRDRGHILMPDHIVPLTEVMESTDMETAFEQDLLPILTARCALSGCHVADGPHGLDFRTYESFTAGGEHGPAFIPGNAQESEVVKQIVSGRMPPKGPPLTDAEIQLFMDWINHQETQVDAIEHAHSDEHAVENVVHEEMDDAHDADDAHDDNMVDDEHEDVDGEHDAEDDHGDEDDGHDDDDDN